MVTRKRSICYLLLVMVALLFCSGQALAAKKYISIVTGGTAGTYYPIGGGIAEVVNESLPNIEVTAMTGKGSVANINLISNHEVEAGLMQNNIADWAFRGDVLYKGKKPVSNLRAIASLFPEHIHIVTLKSAGIKCIADIKNKKISVGHPGSGGEADAKLILGALGITFNDFEPVNVDRKTASDYMKDKLIDGDFVTIGYPGASIVDIAQKRPISLVSFSDEEIEQITKNYPYYTKAIIPANTYKGIETETQTLAVMCILGVDSQVDKDVVYEFTKQLWAPDNLKRIQQVHEKAKFITLETALDGISIPLHPGAERYYKEVGLIK